MELEILLVSTLIVSSSQATPAPFYVGQLADGVAVHFLGFNDPILGLLGCFLGGLVQGHKFCIPKKLLVLLAPQPHSAEQCLA